MELVFKSFILIVLCAKFTTLYQSGFYRRNRFFKKDNKIISNIIVFPRDTISYLLVYPYKNLNLLN